MKKLLFFAFAALVLVACNGQKGPGELTGASLSKSTLELAEGQEYRLTVRAEPEGASFKATWSSDDEWVASVAENGTVSANAVGTATISAAIEGTDIVAKCQVTVKSVLETTVFDRAALFGLSDEHYQVVGKGYSGEDSVYTAAEARYMILPSTMYIDGDGYLAGDGGYILAMETAFYLGMSGDEVTSWICLANYKAFDNIRNEEGHRIPFTFQAAQFNANTYAEYYTLALRAASGQGEKPDPEQYPYYREDDSYFLRAFVSSSGLAYVDGGYPTVGNASGIIRIMEHPENKKWQAPVYYDFDAKVFSNPGNYGFAIGEKTDEETGETIYVYLDENGDGAFDMAPLNDFHFAAGELEQQQAPAQQSIRNIGAIPAKVGMKQVSINRTLHVALCVKANI